MRESKPRMPKQYAPGKFCEPFSPNSVEGVLVRRRQAEAIRIRKEEAAELAEIDGLQAAEEVRLAARSLLGRLWDRLFGL
jgi:hypothetical protein